MQDTRYCNFRNINTLYEPVKILESVNNVISKEDYVSYDINGDSFSSDACGYLSVIYKVDVKGVTHNGNKETNIILKTIIPNDHLTLLSLTDAYKRELFVYKELSEIYNELQDEANVPLEDRYKFVKHYDDSDKNVIILENMCSKGFKTCNRMEVITLEFAEMAVKQLAKFHALSFAVEAKLPKYFNRKIKSMKQPFNFDEYWKVYIRNMSQITLNYLNEDTKQKLEKFIPLIFVKHPKYLNDNVIRRCLCHGDYRINNILIKEKNGNISEVIPIDYQIVYYGSPVLDFLYFIFSGTDQKFRRMNLTTLKDLYYITLGRFLKYFDLNIDCVYPKKVFEKEYLEMLDFGLIVALNLVPFTMAEEGGVPDITKGAISGVKFRADERCRDRMVGIVSDYIKWGYL